MEERVRSSIYVEEFKHANPIPSASRIGNIVMSSVIIGRDLHGNMPGTLEAQCANMFSHVRAILEAAGGSTNHILKMSVWLKDRSRRDVLNTEWLKMFPDETSRPARHSFQTELQDGALVQCDFVAVIC